MNAILLMPRRYGRSAIARALRATGDDNLTPEQHRALFQGRFSIEAQDSELVALAEEYERRAEAYDRTVCTGPIGPDGIMPATHAELAAINRHAHQVRRELVERAVRAGFTETQFKEAMMHQARRGPSALAARATRQDRPAAWMIMDEYFQTEKEGD
jgi:hypothetical protein